MTNQSLSRSKLSQDRFSCKEIVIETDKHIQFKNISSLIVEIYNQLAMMASESKSSGTNAKAFWHKTTP